MAEPKVTPINEDTFEVGTTHRVDRKIGTDTFRVYKWDVHEDHEDGDGQFVNSEGDKTSHDGRFLPLGGLDAPQEFEGSDAAIAAAVADIAAG